MPVIAVLEQIVSYLLTLIGLAQFIAGKTGHAAQETSPYFIQDRVKATLDDVDNVTFGLNALHNQLVTLQTSVNSITGGSAPVTLPNPPPAGYGYAGDSTIFNAVWNGLNSPDVQTPYIFLRQVGTESLFRSGYAPFYQSGGIFAYNGPVYDEFGITGSFFPLFDTTAILPTDNLLSFIASQNPGAGTAWVNGIGSNVFISGDTGDGTVHFNTMYDDAWFQDLKASLFPLDSGGIAPVWPGFANVTLGTPVAIGLGATIPGPMNGVLVDITAVPAKAGYYDFDGTLSYRNLGGLSFVSDDGQNEFPQNLGFQQAVYCPKSMGVAASCKLRAIGGVTGTVTPWSTN